MTTQRDAHLRHERGLLECLLFAPQRFDDIAESVEAKHFIGPLHRQVWTAMVALLEADMRPDIVSLTDRLEAGSHATPEGGWLAIVSELAEQGYESASIVTRAKSVANAWRLREIIRIAAWASESAAVESADSALSILERLQDDLSALEPGISGVMREITVGDAARAVKADVSARLELAEEHRLPGMPTGYRRLDFFTGGWCAEFMYLLTGRTSHGKSAMALSLCLQAARRKQERVCFVSLEMGEGTTAGRIIANAGGADAQKMRLARMDDDDVTAMVHGVARCVELGDHFTIVHAPSLNVGSLARLVRRLKRRKGPPLGLVCIDYIQLIEAPGTGSNREREVAKVSGAIKTLAGLYQVAMLVLAQVNEEGAVRESKKIKQDADVHMHMQPADGEDVTSSRVLYDLEFQKNRHGNTCRLGDFQWTFIKPVQRFAVVDNRGDVQPHPGVDF